MLIEVKCLCGHRFKAEEELAGQRVPCAACWRTVVIPVKNVATDAAALPFVAPALPTPVVTSPPKPGESSAALLEPPSESGRKISAKCLCGKLIYAAAGMVGRKVPCPGCWRMIIVPPDHAMNPLPPTASAPVVDACAAPAPAPPPARPPAPVAKALARTIAAKCLCGALIQAPLDMAGKKLPCPGCWRTISVPLKNTPDDPVPAPAAQTNLHRVSTG